MITIDKYQALKHNDGRMLAVVLLALIFSSCQKEEISNPQLLVGDWRQISFSQSSLDTVPNYHLDFTGAISFTAKQVKFAHCGTFEYLADNTGMEIIGLARAGYSISGGILTLRISFYRESVGGTEWTLKYIKN